MNLTEKQKELLEGWKIKPKLYTKTIKIKNISIEFEICTFKTYKEEFLLIVRSRVKIKNFISYRKFYGVTENYYKTLTGALKAANRIIKEQEGFRDEVESKLGSKAKEGIS